MIWPFENLQPMSYGLVKADPPWSFDNWSEGGNAKNAKAQYDCMPTAEIARLPVGHLAGGDCWLMLWATSPMLPDAFEVMKSWDFKFVTAGCWVKRGPSGKLAFGTGYVLRTAAEFFLLGKIGNPPTFSKSVRNVIEGPRRQHSRKPDQAYTAAEKLFGPVRRADLFSRQTRPGWDSWGYEKSKFDAGDPGPMKRAVAAPVLVAGPLDPMPLFPEILAA